MTTTRFINGVTNVTKQNVLGQYKNLDPSINHELFDDFDTYNAADWTVTTVGTSTEALANEDGGVLALTNSAADDDSVFLQKASASFLMELGKKTFFKARFKLLDATESDAVIGLQITDATPLDVTDGVFFRKDDGDANLDFVVEKDDTATEATAITTLENDTYITVGFAFDGKEKIEYFAGANSKNPTRLGQVTIENLPDDEVLTVSFGVSSTSGTSVSVGEKSLPSIGNE